MLNGIFIGVLLCLGICFIINLLLLGRPPISGYSTYPYFYPDLRRFKDPEELKSITKAEYKDKENPGMFCDFSADYYCKPDTGGFEHGRKILGINDWEKKI